MDKDNVGYIHNGVLFNHKEEWNYVVGKKMDRNKDHHIKWNKPDLERDKLHVLSSIESGPKNWHKYKMRSCFGVGIKERSKGKKRWRRGMLMIRALCTHIWK
jgi:hypothetical protein